jgi:hypothetical protein
MVKVWQHWTLFVAHSSFSNLQAALNRRNEEFQRVAAKHKQVAVKLALFKHRNHRVIPAFHAWKCYVKFCTRNRRMLMERVIKQPALRQLKQIWRLWSAYATLTSEQLSHDELAREKINLSSRLNAQRKARIEVSIRAVRLKVLVPAFSKLKLSTKLSRNRRITSIKKVIRRNTLGLKWAAWRRWKEFLVEQAHVHVKNKMNYDISSLQTEIALRVRSADEQRQALLQQKRACAQSMIRSKRLATVLPAFRSWRENSRSSKQLKHRIRHLLMRSSFSSLHASWLGWTAHLQRLKLKKHEMLMHERIKSYAVHRGSHELTARKHELQISVFREWKHVAKSERIHKRTILRACVCQMSRRQAMWVWAHWRYSTDRNRMQQLKSSYESETIRLESLLQTCKQKAVEKFTSRHRIQLLIACMQSWRRTVRDRKILCRQMLQTLIRHLHAHTLGGSWERWRTFAAEKAYTGKKNELQLLAEHLRRELTQSRQAVAQQKHKRAQALVVTSRKTGLIPCFIEWREHARVCKARRAMLLRRMLLKMSNHAIGRAWHSWRFYSEQAAARSAQLQLRQSKQARAATLIERRRSVLMVKAFSQWAQHVKTVRSQKHSRMRCCVRLMAFRALGVSFRKWKLSMEKAREAQLAKRRNFQSRLELMSTRHTHKVCRLQFQSWRNHTRTVKAERKNLLGPMLRRLVSHRISAAWHHWARFVLERKVHEIQTGFHGRVNVQNQQIAELKRNLATKLVNQRRVHTQVTCFP